MAELQNREGLVAELTGRVIENAPLRELVRVYSEAVQGALTNLSDAELVQSIDQAGYVDILTAHDISVPDFVPAEPEAVAV